MQAEDPHAELMRLRRENETLRERDRVLSESVRELSQAKIDADADHRIEARRLRRLWIESEDRCVAIASRAVIRKQKIRRLRETVRDVREANERVAKRARLQAFAERGRRADVGELTELLYVLSCFRPDVFVEFLQDPANERFRGAIDALT